MYIHTVCCIYIVQILWQLVSSNMKKKEGGKVKCTARFSKCGQGRPMRHWHLSKDGEKGMSHTGISETGLLDDTRKWVASGNGDALRAMSKWQVSGSEMLIFYQLTQTLTGHQAPPGVVTSPAFGHTRGVAKLRGLDFNFEWDNKGYLLHYHPSFPCCPPPMSPLPLRIRNLTPVPESQKLDYVYPGPPQVLPTQRKGKREPAVGQGA